MKLIGRVLRCAALACALASCGLASPAYAASDADKPDAPAPSLEDRELVQALREGGYIIYFRHGITDLSTEDSDRSNLANCATQRRLSQEGREQMRAIGEAFAALRIRVSTILSSPYCRSLDTAKLAFGRAEIAPELRHTVTASQQQAARQARALRKLLGTPPPEPGTNTVLSGHTGNLQEATGIWPKPEGVAVIFRPGANASFGYVATVHPDRWQAFVQEGY